MPTSPSLAADSGVSKVSLDALMPILEQRMLAAFQNHLTDTEFLSTEAIKAVVYHLSAGGRRIRARLALHASLSLGLDAEDALVLATTAELLHNASLIHDDLQDRDPERRGMSSVWSLYGDNVAICAGDLLLSSAYGALAELLDRQRMPALMACVNARTITAIRGQCADLATRTQPVNDIVHYQAIAATKSGALLSLPLELALLAARHDDAAALARRAAEAFAIGYQIADDIADVQRDAADASRPGSLNVVHVLEVDQDRGGALAKARSLGLEQLSAAALAASQLPHGSGGLLRHLALRLSAHL
jgi:geranylgeranyl pyrophosphate synthase